MKKNRMMRLASMLLVAVLVTTTTISGTYAKYVTQDAASDSARVAKFGVVVKATGHLFSDAYQDTETTYIVDEELGTITVQAEAKDDKVVAPGTKNTDGITFTITGTPEVDTKLRVEVETMEEVFLKEGTYEDMTTGDEKDFFAFSGDYYPVKFTLTQKKGLTTTTLVDGGRLSAVKTELEALSGSIAHTNQDLSEVFGTLNLTWAWDFTDHIGPVELDDKQDTVLGDLAAAKVVKFNANTTEPADWDAFIGGAADAIDDTHYNLDTGIRINVRVEQID